MNECKNCGRPIKISIFKGGDWCSELCRKALAKDQAERARTKCEYERVGTALVCFVHGAESKYDPFKGPHRPCLAVEGY